ncbi:radical SAM protein [bacterium 1XD42-1]|nr:radical SAM protein [Oscillospiraceae bacterium]MCI9669915.1 radical SAM protein [Oscillospiraceae bacterium]RKJ52868.1 radical SAM protein [bacterium 1XD42-8]RKJ62553.1 radical SAM protein [bacterium 1XD42-1]
MIDIKASYNEERLCLGEKLPLDTPLSVILDISERCNFKCNYCFRSTERNEGWDYAAKNNLITMKLLKLAVKQLGEFPQKIKSISLSGHGEPLCNPELISIVRYLKKADVTERIEMHTNASVLTEETAKNIAQSGFSKIVVSLQGLDADTYQKVCGIKLNWNTFYERLQILYQNKSSELKIHIKISEAALKKENYEAEKERFYSMFGPIANTVSIEKVTPLWKNLRVGSEEMINKYGQKIGIVECCPIVFYKIWVAPDGEIYPCTGLPAPMSFGNIRNTSLTEAWNGQKRQEFLRSHLRRSRGGYAACMDCFVPVNTVTMDKDRIDPYRKEILARMGEFANE